MGCARLKSLKRWAYTYDKMMEEVQQLVTEHGAGNEMPVILKHWKSRFRDMRNSKKLKIVTIFIFNSREKGTALSGYITKMPPQIIIDILEAGE